jgi:cytochrome P450
LQAFSLPECTAVPKIIGGFRIPAKTAVVIDAGRLNTDPLTWGPSSTDFRPERFEMIPPLKCRYELMRFGVGGNSGRCLGKNFADAIFKLAAMAVLQQYETRLPEKSSGQQDNNLVRFTLIHKSC